MECWLIGKGKNHEFLAETAKNRTEQAKAQRLYLHQFRQDLFASICGTHI
jgi:gas vesicle GvpC-like protein